MTVRNNWPDVSFPLTGPVTVQLRDNSLFPNIAVGSLCVLFLIKYNESLLFKVYRLGKKENYTMTWFCQNYVCEKVERFHFLEVIRKNNNHRLKCIFLLLYKNSTTFINQFMLTELMCISQQC